MSTPMLTVAMPFFNSAATLELTIRSLLHQSYGDFELLLCDDGSTDRSLAIVQSFDDPRLLCWSDGRRCRLAARLNECIDRARGQYIARMDADDIAYPDRFAYQLALLMNRPEIDLCGAGAMVFGKHGRPLWRFNPALDHAGIAQSPFRGFPLWHPVWMGRTAWFRRWRYQESAYLAQDQELLLRSYRQSRFANLPQVLLGYRREQPGLRKLLRYKFLHLHQLHGQAASVPNGVQEVQLLLILAARFGVNIVAAIAGSEKPLGHQAARAPTLPELEEWNAVWKQLSTWYSPPSNEIFVPAALLPRAQKERPLHDRRLP